MIDVTKDNATLGTFVVRGRHWKWNDQDCINEEEVAGEIIRVRNMTSPHGDEDLEYGWVSVVWNDAGRLEYKDCTENTYRIGCEDSFDLAIWTPECDLEEEIEI